MAAPEVMIHLMKERRVNGFTHGFYIIHAVAMKWWGWGSPDFEFPMDEKPHLWPWIAKTLALERAAVTPPVDRAAIKLPPSARVEAFCRAAGALLSFDEDQRLLHSYGKSYPDLFHVRRGVVRRAPDAVAFPESHADVETLVGAAAEHGVCLIPFGGGTNIVGGVTPRAFDGMVVTVSLTRMDRLLSIDPYSGTALIEAGALGPKLEADLQAKGFSLGHFPDSFEYSSLGGWIATRSAGMQSDAYGKIEDMVVALKMVTPSGTLVTRPTPASSAGPDLNRLMAGSEGTLGVITECTMRVHKAPAVKDYRGFLFRSFEDGYAAIYECVATGRRPSLIRLQDEFETELAFNMKTPKTGLAGLVQRQMKKVLKLRGYVRPVIMIVGVEGDRAFAAQRGREVRKILRKHGGFDLGQGVGKSWSKDKFNLPYLRDYVMDHGCAVDVAETATVWANVVPLHDKVVAAMMKKFEAEGTPGFIGCHLSHTYATGACLYFTWACRQQKGRELEQYYSFKKTLTQLFVENGATLSHHHAVGTEHRPWMEQELSKTGVQALRALKDSLDPRGLLNPGKLIPSRGDPMKDWAQPTRPAEEAEVA
jgi:alkyldihydroxyacetonephosphate synthase